MSAITITRIFALLPKDAPFQSYKEITNLLVKERALKNRYVALMVADIKKNSYDSYHSTSISKFRQAIYDRLDFSQVISPQFQKLLLKERAKQCAFYDAYLSVREWVKRVENLRRIIDILREKCRKDKEFTISFLKGKRFYFGALKEFKQALLYDCFHGRQDLSNDFLNNYVLHVRNLFFSCNDFQSEKLFLESDFSNSLQKRVKEKFQSLYLTDELIERVATGFNRKKKGKDISVPRSTLAEYMLDCYFRKLQWITTRKAQQILSLRKKIKMEEKIKKRNHIKLERYHIRLKNLISILSLLIGDMEFSSQKEFKKKRALLLEPLKKRFLDRIETLDIERLIREGYHKELLDFKQSQNQFVLKRIFKPHFPKIMIGGIDYDSFIQYFVFKLQYKVRELLKQYFISNQFISLMSKQFQVLKEEIYAIVTIPQHKTLSLSIINRDVYKEEFANKEQNKNFKIKLGLVARQFKTFKIKDEKKRIKNLIENQFTPALPTISLKHRKLLLHLPFKKQKKDCSKPSQNTTNPVLEMGIDLGLKHFAVLSIWNKEQNKEVIRYFLGPKELLDMKFNIKDGKLTPLKSSSSKNNPSNMKMKLIRLRKQIKTLQKKKDEYEQRLLLQNITNFRRKLKWNKVRRTLSLCWDRLHRLHLQIIHHLNHYIIAIAKFYNISTIKVEDLRWVTHVKKRDAGKFLSFWQTHWFNSQIQTAVKLQSQLYSIRFQKVPAFHTSKRCSCCNKIGLREGKQFTCPHYGLKLDSDLNASRNIVKYRKKNKTIPQHIDTPYMGCQDLQLQVNKEDVHKCPDF